jgi:hypothetical protein
MSEDARSNETNAVSFGHSAVVMGRIRLPLANGARFADNQAQMSEI